MFSRALHWLHFYASGSDSVYCVITYDCNWPEVTFKTICLAGGSPHLEQETKRYTIGHHTYRLL